MRGIIKFWSLNDISDINDTLCRVISDKVLLQVLPTPSPTNLVDEICEGDSILFASNYLSVAGQYADTLNCSRWLR